MQNANRHLIISGTGRAGTSFLVRFLTEIGLETTLSRQGDAAYWDDHAEAGLEQAPILKNMSDLPYVIKYPNAAEILRDAVKKREIKIDAIIVPMRRLEEAAASRTILEMRMLHEHQPWRSALDEIIPTHGTTPGGVLYSLHPLDQARLLATAFHDLVLLAAEAEIPLYTVAFPRLAHDCAYLWRSIKAAVPGSYSDDILRAAYDRVSSASKIRVEKELEAEGKTGSAMKEANDLYRMENIALKRELRRLAGIGKK